MRERLIYIFFWLFFFGTPFVAYLISTLFKGWLSYAIAFISGMVYLVVWFMMGVILDGSVNNDT